jgi:hypothetical protein
VTAAALSVINQISPSASLFGALIPDAEKLSLILTVRAIFDWFCHCVFFSILNLHNQHRLG